MVGAVVVALGIGLLALWLGPEEHFYAARFGVAATIAGLALLFSARLLKPAPNLEHAGAAPPMLPAVRFLGRDTNLIVVQLFATAHMIDRAFWQDVDSARLSAGVVIGLAVLLYPSRARLVPMLLAAAAAAYFVTVTALMTSFAFESDMQVAAIVEPDLPVPLWPVFWLVAAFAAFPQLQLVRLGSFRIGGVKGDVVIRRSSTPVLLAFGSAILLAALIATVYALVQAGHWISVAFN